MSTLVLNNLKNMSDLQVLLNKCKSNQFANIVVQEWLKNGNQQDEIFARIKIDMYPGTILPNNIDLSEDSLIVPTYSIIKCFTFEDFCTNCPVIDMQKYRQEVCGLSKDYRQSQDYINGLKTYLEDLGSTDIEIRDIVEDVDSTNKIKPVNNDSKVKVLDNFVSIK